MTLSWNDIRKNLYDLRKEGRQKEELEALLIHSDDLAVLFQAMQEWRCLLDDSGEIRIGGVKIIESQYVQKGSIFKIFKNAAPYAYPPGEVNGMTKFGGYVGDDVIQKCQNERQAFLNNTPSGVVSTSDLLPTIPVSGTFNTSDHPQPPVVADKKKEEKKQKHSSTRKIDLD